jgi:hypothetical protein
MQQSIIAPRFPTARLFVAILTIFPAGLQAQRISDIKVRYSRMAITEATLEKVGTVEIDFYRHFAELEVGLGQAFVGLTYQHATKNERTTEPGKKEDGLMLTAGYNYIFSHSFRLDAYGRLGIWGDTDPAQPLYATDTDLRLNLVGFFPDGFGMLGPKPIFPSSYLGIMINKYGRVQNLVGAGLWWNGISVYATGLISLNGVEDVTNPGNDANKLFANLKNRGVSLALSYHFRDVMVGLARNFALMNGGNDLVLSLQYQRFFQKRRIR